MKNHAVRISFILALCLTLAIPVFAETMDKTWIITENTGNSATFVKLDNPDLVQGQVIMVYLEQSGLSGKYGEGSTSYTYTYYSETGKKIWTSPPQLAKKLTKDATWKLSSVTEVTLPETIPQGTYRIGYELTDIHTQTVYNGNIHFTVNMAKAAVATVPAAAIPASTAVVASAFTCKIGKTDVTLVSLIRQQNKLLYTFKVLNGGDINSSVKIIRMNSFDSNGQQFVYDWQHSNLDGSLYSGQNFVSGLETKADANVTLPEAFTNGPISYLDILFNDEHVIWKNIPLPYNAK